MLLIRCVISGRESSDNNLSTAWGMSPTFLCRFFHFNVQDIRVHPVCICFLFGFNLQVFWSISSVVELCSMILPNYKYMHLMGNCIHLRVFSGPDPMIPSRTWIKITCTLKVHVLSHMLSGYSLLPFYVAPLSSYLRHTENWELV